MKECNMYESMGNERESEGKRKCNRGHRQKQFNRISLFLSGGYNPNERIVFVAFDPNDVIH